MSKQETLLVLQPLPPCCPKWIGTGGYRGVPAGLEMTRHSFLAGQNGNPVIIANLIAN